MRHTRFEHRATIDLRADGDAVLARLASLFARRPTDRVERTQPTRVRYRIEPPWFLGVAGISFALLGALVSWSNAHAPVTSFAAWSMVVLLEGAAGISLAQIALALFARLEIAAAHGRVELLRMLGPWSTARVAIDPADVTAVLVVGRRGARRVVLVGGRNEELAELYAERWADPPALATWWADVAASLAEAAEARVDDLVAATRPDDPPARDSFAERVLRD